MGASLVTTGILTVASAIVGATLGPAALGLYWLGSYISSIPRSGFSQLVNQVAVALFSRSAQSAELLADAFTRALSLLMAAAVPAFVLLATLADPLIRFTYGARWMAAAPALTLLAILSLLGLIYELTYSCLVVVGKARVLLAIQIWWLAILIPPLLIGARLHGINGVAGGQVLVAGLLVCPALLRALSRCGIPVHSILAACIRPLLGGLLMAAVIELVLNSLSDSLMGLAAAATAATIAYVPVARPMRTLRHFLPQRQAPDMAVHGIGGQREHADRSTRILFADKQVT